MAKNILLTGVSKGLGLEIAKTLLNNGYTVYGISRSRNEDLERLSLDFGERFHHQAADLSDPESASHSIFQDFLPLDTPIHGFVNNAALAYDDLITNLQLEPLERMFRVNVYSPMSLTRGVLRNMLLHQTEGSLVHISSISVHTGYKGLAMYAASKGALEAFSKNTAREWGSRGIRSNCIVAGFMETEMSGSLSDDQKNRIYRRTALGRSTSLHSVAAMVAHLLSDDAKSITGQNLFVDSGTI